MRRRSVFQGSPLNGIFLTVFTCIVLFFFPAWTKAGDDFLRLHKVPGDEIPQLEDELEGKNLDMLLQRSFSFLSQRPDQNAIYCQTDEGPYTVRQAKDSLSFFLRLLRHYRAHDSVERLWAELPRYFDLFTSPESASQHDKTKEKKSLLVTGYYQPLFDGRLHKQAPYLYPLYRIPDDLAFKHILGGEKLPGRLEEWQFLPYWTRGEIMEGNLLQGQELVWLDDPFSAFTLHIQGSGLIRLANGKIRGVHYAAKNGRQYRSIGRYMINQGFLSLDNIGMESIGAFLTQHPEKRAEIFAHNESFIFFTWVKTMGAVGNLGLELIAGRSVAADQAYYPPGALAFLTTRQPFVQEGTIVRWEPLYRFVAVQDCGSAIQGPHRLDFFWGTGDTAGLKAGRMKEQGQAYVLLLKKNIWQQDQQDRP